MMVFDCADNLYNGFKYYEKLYKLGNGGKVFAKIIKKHLTLFGFIINLEVDIKLLMLELMLEKLQEAQATLLSELLVWFGKAEMLGNGQLIFL